MTGVVLVALGGGVGAALRYLVGVGATRLFGPGFPVGTMTVNVLGSFAMGILVAWLAARAGEGQATLTRLLATGFLGGFTTFSSFSLDAVALWERGQGGLAMLYVGGSVALALVGIVAGLAVGRAIL